MRQRPVLRLATRGSRLALIQADEVVARLRACFSGLDVEVHTVSTRGDRAKDVPLAELQGPDGVFTRGIEQELLAGRADLAVHSLKDLPTMVDPALALAAFPPRADVRDVLVAPTFRELDRLPAGARVGTSSPRRAAQVLAWRPDLEVVPIRGNVDTRLRKPGSPEAEAVVLAAAGLARLGRLDEVTEWLPIERFTPAVGQGALAVQCRAEDAPLCAMLAAIDDLATRRAVTAERVFLRAVGGGCRVPVGAYAAVDGDRLTLRGFMAAPDGTEARFETARGPVGAPRAVGQELAERMLSSAGPVVLAGVRGG